MERIKHLNNISTNYLILKNIDLYNLNMWNLNSYVYLHKFNSSYKPHNIQPIIKNYICFYDCQNQSNVKGIMNGK
jgi:hypothetical protein